MKNPMMILVKGGSYDMGSNGGANDEKPIHHVTLSDFYIGKYPVTQKQMMNCANLRYTAKPICMEELKPSHETE
jgi:formylglycine-generating enzyme required for sulfatase activity